MNWILLNEILNAVQVGITLDALRAKFAAAEADNTAPDVLAAEIRAMAAAKIEEAKRA